jgi:Predicted chitinase
VSALQLTVVQLALATGAQRSRASAMFEGLNDAIELFNINTEARVGMLLTNVGHETLRLRYLSEVWGPTKQQRRYERDFTKPWPSTPAEEKRARDRDPHFAANRLAWVLGNDAKGDGKRYAGHGFLQNTGKTNHRLATQRLRKRLPMLQVPDFELAPSQLATPYWGWMAAAEYAERVGCWEAADEGRFDNFCDLINLGRETSAEGDSNGYEDRLALWQEFNERGGLAAA